MSLSSVTPAEIFKRHRWADWTGFPRGSDAAHLDDLDAPDATWACPAAKPISRAPSGDSEPDLTTFCRLEARGLEEVGQRLDPDRAVLACRVVDADQWCRRCGCDGMPRDMVTRRLAREPLGWRTTMLLVTAPPLLVQRVRVRVALGHHRGRPNRGLSCCVATWAPLRLCRRQPRQPAWLGWS